MSRDTEVDEYEAPIRAATVRERLSASRAEQRSVEDAVAIRQLFAKGPSRSAETLGDILTTVVAHRSYSRPRRLTLESGIGMGESTQVTEPKTNQIARSGKGLTRSRDRKNL